MTEQNIEQKAWENPEPDTPKLGISRRVFLGTGMTAAAAAFILPREAIALISEVPSFTLPKPNPFVCPSFCDPTEFTFTEGENELLVGEGKLTLPGYTAPISVRLYNGVIPGPTFRRNPGENIEFTLINNLASNEEPDKCKELQHNNKPGCFNTTNMHFHGLHVSPKSNDNVSSDDVFVEVEPEGRTRQYCVAIPQFHAPGTHWYHAHRHGATGIQVANGMAGAIIIPEPDGDRRLGVTEDNDKIWLIQEILDVSKGNKFYTARGGKFQGDSFVKGQFLVNGQYQPTLTIDDPNTLQRWRFINATGTPRGLMTLKLYKCDNQEDTDINPENCIEDMYLIAVDGISFYGHKPQKVGNSEYKPYKDGWEFAPGNRADFLVSLPAGRYKLVKDKYKTQSVTPSNDTTQVLAYIQVKDGNAPKQDISQITIEGKLPSYLQPIDEREIKTEGPGSLEHPQNVSFGRSATRKYTINGDLYDEEDDYKVALNTAEQWVLSNEKGSPHPFHIHVNPFQIKGDLIDPNEDCNNPSNWRWWDTIAVNQGGPDVTIRHRFRDFDGKFVLHCHILIHEDQGMMANVKIEEKVTGPGESPSE